MKLHFCGATNSGRTLNEGISGAEEALEDLKGRIELIMEIVQQESDQNVQGVCGHVCGMTAQERRIKSQPAFKQKDGLLQQIVLANKLRELLDEVQGE